MMKVDIKIEQSEDLDDFNQLLSVFDMVFEYKPYTRPPDEHQKNLLKNNKICVIVAKVNDKVIAGLTAYSLEQYHSIKPILYVQDLAVLTEYQRKGVGRKLMEYLISYCRDHNYQQLFIQAEKMDEYAVAFYRSTKPTDELEVVHFSYTIKKP